MIKSITTSDGEKIVYNHTQGSGHETVILIHGLGGDFSAWHDLELVLLGLGFSCVAIDLRGHGGSSRPSKSKKYSLERLGQDILEVVEAEKLKKVIVVSHCLGAVVAQFFISDNPQKVSNNVMLAPLNKAIPGLIWLQKKQLLSNLASYFLMVMPGAKISKRYFELPRFNGRSDFSGRRIASDLARTSLKSYFSIFFRVLLIDLNKKIESISAVPTLILFGAKDKVVSKSVIRDYKKILPNAKIVILKQANHQLLLTDFDGVVGNIKEWLPN